MNMLFGACYSCLIVWATMLELVKVVKLENHLCLVFPFQCCSCHLQCSDLEEGPMVQSLCAMMLLEGCSPRQAFAKFLVARKAAIQSVFQAAILGEGPHRSVKSQVCQITRSVLHSLLHISAIFCQQRMPDGSLGIICPIILCIQAHVIPYSGKLSREKSFVDFEV